MKKGLLYALNAIAISANSFVYDVEPGHWHEIQYEAWVKEEERIAGGGIPQFPDPRTTWEKIGDGCAYAFDWSYESENSLNASCGNCEGD